MNRKPLISSAPAYSILSAEFRYTNSAATNIRKTFARIRSDRAQANVVDKAAGSVGPLVRKLQEAPSQRLLNGKKSKEKDRSMALTVDCRAPASRVMARSLRSVFTVAVALLSVPALGQDPPPSEYPLARERGCMYCHDVEAPPRGSEGLLPPGPPFEEIARRYHADPTAAARLASIVRHGTGPLRRDRHWESRASFVSMYPNEVSVTEAEARRLVDWILTLAPAQPGSRSAQKQRAR
jgi:cytochrome c